MKTVSFFGLVVLLFVLGFVGVYGQNPIVCDEPEAQIDLNINNVSARLLTAGDMWWDPFAAQPLYEVPAGSGKTPFFSMGCWIAGIDANQQLKVAAPMYRQSGVDFWPGPLDENGETTPGQCESWDRFWKIDRPTILDFRDGLLPSIPDEILTWPAYGNPLHQNLAPFVDVNGDGIYNPYDGDYPSISGDQSVWWVCNDRGAEDNIHAEADNSVPLQFELQMEAYAFNCTPALLNHTFYKLRIINKSNIDVDSCLLGFYVDVDLGSFDDDHLGCDTINNMGFGYNGDTVDGIYGSEIPAVGVKLLQGPRKADGSFAGMYAFRELHGDFSVTGMPENPTEDYWVMHGRWLDNTEMQYGGNGYQSGGHNTRYIFPSDPADISPDAWSECSVGVTPADRRFLMSTGHFNLAPGEWTDVHFAALFVPHTELSYPCPDLSGLRAAAVEVQSLFDNGWCYGESPLSVPPDVGEDSQPKVYPNPLPGGRAVVFEFGANPPESGSLRLFDSGGALVAEYKMGGSASFLLLTEGLTPGIYHYDVSENGAPVHRGKIVVVE